MGHAGPAGAAAAPPHRRRRGRAEAPPGEPPPPAHWAGLDDLFRHVPLGEDSKRRLFEEMNRPGRLYHGVNHIAQLWRRHRRFAAEAGLDDPDIDRLMACTIAWHDSVYDPLRGDNEERSAGVWLDASKAGDLSAEDREWVAETIRATKNHLAYRPNGRLRAERSKQRERARQWMLDLDLSTLGDPPKVFEANTRQLRSEFAHQSDKQWMEKLRGFYSQLLHAPRIYRTPSLATRYEAQARRNLTAAMARDCQG